jgi:hypothetical protein
MVLLRLLDRVEVMMKREEEENKIKKEKEMEEEEYGKMIERLREMVEVRGKREVMKELGLKNNPKLMDRVLNGYDGYSYCLYKRIKKYVVNN